MEKLLTTKEVAEMLGVPRRTVDDWRQRGVGPAFVKVGRHVRYRPTDLAAYTEAHLRAVTG